MEYLLKASAVIAIFYILYKLFLQRETFFQTNRGYLLIGLLTSVLIPLIVIPIYIEYTPAVVEGVLSHTISPEVQQNINEGTVQQSSNEVTFDWWTFAVLIYAMGVTFFLAKLLIELASLKFLFSKHLYFKSGPYMLIETENDIPPFSFFNWIVYNPKRYAEEELQHILNHEKAHASQLHSIDIMLTQLACVLLWFNPLVWLYKKEVQQNLEFIADKKAQDFSSCEKSYQLILLKASVPQHKFLITNNFYNSQIKKRIIMLHKSKSKKVNAWKYSLVLPILALFLMSFNTKEIFIEKEVPEDFGDIPQLKASQQLNDIYDAIESNERLDETAKTEVSKAKNKAKTTIDIKPKATTVDQNSEPDTAGSISITVIDKNTTDAELDKIKDDLKKEGLTVKFKGVKRNSSGEITAIKIDAKSKNSNANYNVSSDDAINPVKIIYDTENESISIGNGHTRHGKHTVVYETHDGGAHAIHKSGTGNNTFVITETHDGDVVHEQDYKVVVKQRGRRGKGRTVRRSKNVEVISGDDDVVEIIVEEEPDQDVVEIIVEEDVDHDSDVIIVNGKRVDINEGKAEIIVKENGKNVWISSDGDDKDVIAIEDKDGNNNIYISGIEGDPLIIVDGKEVSREKFKSLNPKKIKTVTVLKDESAIEKYGDKGKNGVIIVKTKN
ncbi:MAG: M56 family metallopeptidase [Bacteroidota bacterium]